MPADTTALLQPTDQVLIQALKVHCHKSLLQRMLVCMNWDKEYKVDILHAICLTDDARMQLTASTTANCFRHARFPLDVQASDVQDLPGCNSEITISEDDIVKRMPLRSRACRSNVH